MKPGTLCYLKACGYDDVYIRRQNGKPVVIRILKISKYGDRTVAEVEDQFSKQVHSYWLYQLSPIPQQDLNLQGGRTHNEAYDTGPICHVGDRVKFNSKHNREFPSERHLRGTVVSIYSKQQVLVKWDQRSDNTPIIDRYWLENLTQGYFDLPGGKTHNEGELPMSRFSVYYSLLKEGVDDLLNEAPPPGEWGEGARRMKTAYPGESWMWGKAWQGHKAGKPAPKVRTKRQKGDKPGAKIKAPPKKKYEEALKSTRKGGKKRKSMMKAQKDYKARQEKKKHGK